MLIETTTIADFDTVVYCNKYYNKEFECNVYEYENIDYPMLQDTTDLILFLREHKDYIEFGNFTYEDDYQFNDFLICGSDLIDLCRKYDII